MSALSGKSHVMPRAKSYTSANALADLGGKPSEAEKSRLIRYYPTYQYVHRKELLDGLFDGKSHEELVLGKMTAKGLDVSAMTKQAKGGHGKWVRAKVRDATMRLLYLRYRLDQDMTRRQANKKLLGYFDDPKAKDGEQLSGWQSSIRKITYSPVLDGSTSL